MEALSGESDGAADPSPEPAGELEMTAGGSVGELDSCGLKAGSVPSVVTRIAIAVIIPAMAVTRPGSVAQKLGPWSQSRAGVQGSRRIWPILSFEGSAMPFSLINTRVVVPKRAAMALNVSPLFTR